MKFRSLYKSRTENLGVSVKPAEFRKLLNEDPESFYFRWLSESNFIISLNFSFGSHLILDINRPNTKSEILFYGRLTEIEEALTKIELKTRSKYFLATLIVIFPLMVLILQFIVGFDLPVLLLLIGFFPFIIFGLLNIINSEETRLLRNFKEHLNDQILKNEKDN